jgi:hypothetical protein
MLKADSISFFFQSLRISDWFEKGHRTDDQVSYSLALIKELPVVSTCTFPSPQGVFADPLSEKVVHPTSVNTITKMMTVVALTDAERIVMPSKRRFTKSLFDVMVVLQSNSNTLRRTFHG